jgi:type I restriction enzyme M protein
MKEVELKDNNPVDEINNKIWQAVDLLRSVIKTDDLYFTLYLIVLHSERILPNIDIDEDGDLSMCLPPINFDEMEDNLKKKRIESLYYLHDVFKQDFDKISNSLWAEFMSIFRSIDVTQLKEHLIEIFEEQLYKITRYEGRLGGAHLLPIEVSRFLYSLANLQSSPLSVIYNPFAGFATFGVFAGDNAFYFGQEINEKIWAVGQIRLIAHNKLENHVFFEGDSLRDWGFNGSLRKDKTESSNIYFDLIISNPPFGIHIPFQLNGKFGIIRSYEHFLIENGLESLKTGGKMIICVSQGLLFRSGTEQSLRQYLVENDLLEMVISMPSGLLMSSGAPIAVLVINKDKKDKGNVKVVSAENLVVPNSSKEKRLNDSALMSHINSSGESGLVKIVPNKTIASLEFNLNVRRYFLKDFDGVMLRDITFIIRGERITEGHKVKFIRIRDLKDDKFEFELTPENLDDNDLPRQAQRIEESCLLVALRWKTLKPTYFQYTGTPIFISPDILALRVDEKIVNINYLINELHAEYVTEQTNAYRVGETIPSIRRNDLLNVKIVLPNIAEQKEKITEVLSSRVNQLRAESDAIASSLEKMQFDEFASLKHTLGTPRQNILSYAEALIKFFETNSSSESKKVNDTFKEKMGVDLNTAFHAIKHDINFISELLEKGEKGLILRNYELKVVSLTEVLEYIGQLCINHNYNFVSPPPMSFSFMGYDTSNTDDFGIRINLLLLKILLDNIFSNAHKYGFEKKEFSSNHNVIIDFGMHDDGVYLNILNNGKPFPKNLDKEKFITKYKTSDNSNGTGLGGYDINRIAEYFQSEWFLRLNTDPMFPVQFNFWFTPIPIK